MKLYVDILCVQYVSVILVIGNSKLEELKENIYFCWSLIGSLKS